MRFAYHHKPRRASALFIILGKSAEAQLRTLAQARADL